MMKVVRLASMLLLLVLVGCSNLPLAPAPVSTEPVQCPEPVPAQECPQPEPVVCVEPSAASCVDFCPKPKACPPVKCPVCAPRNKGLVIGEIERVFLSGAGIVYDARIDTGAETTSLHAENIRRFERDGERWVSFEIVDPKTGALVELQRPRARRVKIKIDEGEYERRQVVIMNLVIGTESQQVEVNLTNRANMEFPLLIGRNVLQGNFIVDVSRRNTVTPEQKL